MFSIYIAELENRTEAYCATILVYRFDESSVCNLSLSGSNA